MSKLHIKKGDNVKAIAGNSKGKTGTVKEVLVKDNKVIVEGLNVVKRHQKPTSSNPSGAIVEKEAPIHISNLMLIDPSNGQTTRVGRRIGKEGKSERYSVKTKQTI